MSFTKRLVLLLTSILLASGMVAVAAHANDVERGTTASSRLKDRDCSDFPNQRAAQLYYLSIGGPAVDPDNLDSDGDGIACESLPCPCYFGTQPPQPSPSPSPSPTPQPTRVKAIVVKVLDGEKVKVKLLPGQHKVGVQVLGLHAPSIDQCAGPESRSSLGRVLPQGLRVWLYRDPSQRDKTDKGRLLRYINKVSNGKDAGRVQIVRAWAVPEDYAKTFRREADYRRKAKLARQDQRGIWSLC
jgi:endonuclease YncB( thermonuclease family)